MDDEDLGPVFRDAAATAPPPRFSYADVVNTSDRITARHRTVLRGSVAALVVLAGLGGVGGAVALQSQGGVATGSAASAPAADGADGAAREASPLAAPPAAVAGSAPAPLGPGRGVCADRQDPALRALVEQVLPDVAAAPEAVTTDICLPGAQRSLSVEYHGDVLTVASLPAGTAPTITAGSISAPTASGGTVIVPAAYPQLLTYLAPRL